eukprot:jgi/Botrbrau1/1258/Bobra.0163s0051.1
MDGQGRRHAPQGGSFPLPMKREDVVQEAILAISRAWSDGGRRQEKGRRGRAGTDKTRQEMSEVGRTVDEYGAGGTEMDGGCGGQRVEFLLPHSGSLFEASGWPGGIRQQFVAARGFVESTLLELKRLPGLQGSLSAEWVDQPDCVGAWQSPSLAAVLFPTPETLPKLRAIDAAGGAAASPSSLTPSGRLMARLFQSLGLARGAMKRSSS